VTNAALSYITYYSKPSQTSPFQLTEFCLSSLKLLIIVII